MDLRKKTARQLYSRAVGHVVRLLRKRMYMVSQKSFGKLCGVSQKTMSNWERTEDFKNFSLRSLFDLAWVVGVYPSDILRYVEAYLEEKYPGKFDRFKKRRRFSGKVRERWLRDENSRLCVLFDLLYQILDFLSKKKPGEITDEDLKELRMILQKIA